MALAPAGPAHPVTFLPAHCLRCYQLQAFLSDSTLPPAASSEGQMGQPLRREEVEHIVLVPLHPTEGDSGPCHASRPALRVCRHCRSSLLRLK